MKSEEDKGGEKKEEPKEGEEKKEGDPSNPPKMDEKEEEKDPFDNDYRIKQIHRIP